MLSTPGLSLRFGGFGALFEIDAGRRRRQPLKEDKHTHTGRVRQRLLFSDPLLIVVLL